MSNLKDYWLNEIAIEQKENLLQVSAPGDFLKRTIEVRFGNREVSYSQIARICNLSSRAHCRELLSGERRMTTEAVAKFSHGLQIFGLWRKFLNVLVDFQGASAPSNIELLKKIGQLKALLLLDPEADERDDFFEKKWAAVFTQIPQDGCDAQQLAQRTKLSQQDVEEALDHLVQASHVNQDTSQDGLTRYWPNHQHWVSIDQKKRSEFVDGMVERLDWCKRQVVAKPSSDEALFLHSAVTVDPRRLAEFKTRLRELCLDFVNEIEKDSGEETLHLVAILSSESGSLGK